MSDGARIPKLPPAELDDEQRALYDAIAGGRRAQGPQLFRLADADGRLEGPFNAFLLQPRLGSALQARDWSTQRIVRELKPKVLETCAEISSLLSVGNADT